MISSGGQRLGTSGISTTTGKSAKEDGTARLAGVPVGVHAHQHAATPKPQERLDAGSADQKRAPVELSVHRTLVRKRAILGIPGFAALIGSNREILPRNPHREER
jgi:hypothetical protein